MFLNFCITPTHAFSSNFKFYYFKYYFFLLSFIIFIAKIFFNNAVIFYLYFVARNPLRAYNIRTWLFILYWRMKSTRIYTYFNLLYMVCCRTSTIIFNILDGDCETSDSTDLFWWIAEHPVYYICKCIKCWIDIQIILI